MFTNLFLVNNEKVIFLSFYSFTNVGIDEICIAV